VSLITLCWMCNSPLNLKRPLDSDQCSLFPLPSAFICSWSPFLHCPFALKSNALLSILILIPFQNMPIPAYILHLLLPTYLLHLVNLTYPSVPLCSSCPPTWLHTSLSARCTNPTPLYTLFSVMCTYKRCASNWGAEPGGLHSQSSKYSPRKIECAVDVASWWYQIFWISDEVINLFGYCFVAWISCLLRVLLMRRRHECSDMIFS